MGSTITIRRRMTALKVYKLVFFSTYSSILFSFFGLSLFSHLFFFFHFILSPAAPIVPPLLRIHRKLNQFSVFSDWIIVLCMVIISVKFADKNPAFSRWISNGSVYLWHAVNYRLSCMSVFLLHLSSTPPYHCNAAILISRNHPWIALSRVRRIMTLITWSPCIPVIGPPSLNFKRSFNLSPQRYQ